VAHPRFIDMTGLKVGRLTVLAQMGNDRYGAALWTCRCDCGGQITARGASLRNKGVQSCGCLHIEQATRHATEVLAPMAVKHGAHDTREYGIWANMRDRCNNPNCKDYAFYGGRGVAVSQTWDDSFEAFFADMGRSPSPKHSLDRFPDTDGNYEAGNVRWATPIEQANNKRNTRWTIFRGKEMTWAEAYRLASPPFSYSTFCSRMTSGWPVERALS
jgi:hypothetical protein